MRRLTEVEAREVIDLVSQGVPKTHVAERFGASRQNVGNIVRGDSWKRLPRPVSR